MPTSRCPDYHVNGALTLGENIGDNSGSGDCLQGLPDCRWRAKPAPVIDGLTGDQRLYLGWVQVWRGKVREAEAIQRIKTDPHSPPAVRGTAPLRQPGRLLCGLWRQAQATRCICRRIERVSIW